MGEFNRKNLEELHIKDVGTFLWDKSGRKLYYMDGRPIESGKVWLCPHCFFVGWKEIVFAKHMLERHPEYANGKTPPGPTPLSLDQMTKEELLVVAEEIKLDVGKDLKKAELLAEIRAKMPLSDNPKYI